MSVMGGQEDAAASKICLQISYRSQDDANIVADSQMFPEFEAEYMIVYDKTETLPPPELIKGCYIEVLCIEK